MAPSGAAAPRGVLLAALFVGACLPASLAQASDPNFVLWSFVPPEQFYPACTRIALEVGSATADKARTKAACMLHTERFAKGSGADADAHCDFMATQMQAATLQEMWRGGPDFCSKMEQFHSYKLKIDLLTYLGKDTLWTVCSDSIFLAVEQAAGALGPVAAVQSNIGTTCKSELESAFRKKGLPFQLANEGCKHYVPKADAALSAGELSPSDTKQFCDGNSLQATPFEKSDVAPLPEGFPLSASDWTPKVTLAKLRVLIRSAFKTPREAFEKYDADGDGNLDAKEWEAMLSALKVPGMDIKLLFAKTDSDKDGKVSPSEWDAALGVELEELVAYVLDKHKNADVSFKAADANGDGKIDPKEWAAHAKAVGVNPTESAPLFKEVDKNGDGVLSEEEYKDVFGVSLPELKRRARAKFGTPEESFKAFDANGDGNIDPAEFEAACAKLDIPKKRAEKLFAEMDLDGSGGISPEEWDEGMEMTKEEVKQKIFETVGDPEDVLKDMDPDEDGVLDIEDVKKKLEASGLSPEEAAAIAEAMDKDGDGKITPGEWADATGAKDLEDIHGPGTEDAATTGNPYGPMGQKGNIGDCATCSGGAGKLGNGEDEITMPEFMSRAKKTHGTPKSAYKAMDKDNDGNITPEEFEEGCAALNPPVSPAQAKRLFEKLDKDMSGGITPDEFYDEAGGKDKFAGVTPNELKRRAKAAFDTPKDAFEDMDKNGDGKVTPEEFREHCAKLKPSLTPQQADELFKDLDKDGSGDITPEEYYDVLGGPDSFSGPPLTLPDFKRRAKATHGTPKDAFGAFDKDGDGKISPEEFTAGCINLQPAASKQQSDPLFKQMDANNDGSISPEEFYDAVGPPDVFTTSPGDKDHVSLPEYKKRAKAKHGTPKAAYAAMDKDGDGQVSLDEFVKAAAALDPPIKKGAAVPLFEQLDKSGDGSIQPDEYYEAVGPEEGFFPEPGDKDYIAVPEYKKRAKAAHGTPAKAFAAMDKDGDGEVTPEEFEEHCASLEPPISKAQAGPLFKELDSNGSGGITPEEYFASVGPPDAFTTDEGDAGHVDLPEFRRRAKLAHGKPKNAFGAFDKDGDGKLTPEEFIAGCAALVPPIDKAAAVPLFQELDADGNGYITPEEFYAAMGSPEEFVHDGPGGAEPRAGKEAPVSQEEMKDRMKQAFGNGKEAWDAIAGEDAPDMTLDQWKKKAAELGIPPGEAEKLFKEMDTDGSGRVSADEFQNMFGVDEAEVKDRLLDKFGNVDKALEAVDKDGDGKVSKEELEKMLMDDLGLSPEQTKKMAEELMKKYDPNGDGLIEGDVFKKAFGATAEDVKDRISEKIGSAKDAFERWDKNDDGTLSEDEFVAGAMKDLGISEGAAKRMFKEHAGPDGKMDEKEFIKAFGVGPDEVMERCFQHFGNPSKAFEQIDDNQDGLMTYEEWTKGAKKMGFKPDQIERLFNEMDTNHEENTEEHISQWEFFKYIDFEEPAKITWGDGYGDLDHFGTEHKKFNKLPKVPVVPRKAAAPQKALLHKGRAVEADAKLEAAVRTAIRKHKAKKRVESRAQLEALK